ncbi:DNA circularization N-terminal domain-containing protein [Psychromonas aquimarina]|uniref:DNA circularization N-terminal domain-containing protein n=1 Tax=Psychromonas aquimarina TaxID=444919 RepID=UPI0003F754A4|nr:DNA circularization N-terminal domain-containing protein [Psychromonas aquimarina]
MWERKVKTAKWNGVAFNIQQTTLDNGKRLHVAELPYADEPQIKVMGAKAKAVSLEAVFVGGDSLMDANAFVAELEDSPIGSLEHPYLGELSLVYQSSSQSFSTKKGLVTLSLKFLKQGKHVVLTSTHLDEKPVSRLSADVMSASSEQFVRDVEQASPAQITSLQDDFTSLLNTLKSIANRATQGSMRLARLHHQIQDGINAVNTIIDVPAAYAAHLDAVIDSLKKVLFDESSASENNSSDSAQSLGQASPNKTTVSQSLANKTGMSMTQSACTLMHKLIKPGSVSAHCNIQITVAIVLLSEELDLLDKEEVLSFDTFTDSAVENAVDNSIDKAAVSIKVISKLIDDRLQEVTQSADYESLLLVESLDALRESVIKQSNKINTLLQSVNRTEVFSKRPLLCIAQSKQCRSTELSALNAIKHPLFVSGLLRVPNV